GPRGVAPDLLGGMEAAVHAVAGGAAHRDPHPLVARHAEGLLAVAAGAALRLLTCLDGMHRKVIVGMDVARAHTTVVTVGAKLLFVAVGAELRVIRGHEAVPFYEVRRMPRVVEPAGGGQPTRREGCLNPAARPSAGADMAGVAGPLRLAA